LKKNNLASLNKLERLLYDLVSINSTNPEYSKNAAGEKEIGDFIYDYFKKNNVDCIKERVTKDRNNIVAKIDGSNSKNSILMHSHMDTVYLENMNFVPKIIDDKIFGPGSADDKASLATMINLMIDLSRNKNDTRPTVLFVAAVGEELGHAGIRKFIKDFENDLKKLIFSIIGEPTNLNIGIKHKGTLRLKINTMGKSAHGSTPKEGINAIYNMEKLINRLRTKLVMGYNKKINNNLDNPTINIGIINGGTAFNIVPDFCSIEVDRRVISGETFEYAINDFKKIIQELNEEENDFFAEIEKPLDSIPYLDTDKNEKFVKISHKSALKFEQNAEIINLPYTTDGGFLTNLKVPTIVLGPGDIKVCHQKNEYISFDQLNLALKIYEDIILSF